MSAFNSSWYKGQFEDADEAWKYLSVRIRMANGVPDNAHIIVTLFDEDLRTIGTKQAYEGELDPNRVITRCSFIASPMEKRI
jgi:hypothetical protein